MATHLKQELCKRKGSIKTREKILKGHEKERTPDEFPAILPQLIPSENKFQDGFVRRLHCNGAKCSKSKRLAPQLEPLGYKNIRIYAEAIPVWKEKNLAVFVDRNMKKRLKPKSLIPLTPEAEV